MGRRPGRPDAWRSWYSSSGIFRLAVDPGLSVAAPLVARRSRLAFVLPLACLAAARGPGRPGLQRCRQGGLACPAGDRFLRGGRLVEPYDSGQALLWMQLLNEK